MGVVIMGVFKGSYHLSEFTPYTFKTLAELTYITNKGVSHVVPIGFITDGASIPKLFWSFIGSPFTGLYRRAALIHDYLYYIQTTKRSCADRVFLEAMKSLKVSLWKRRVMYYAVRGWGWKPWNKHRKNNAKIED